MHFKAIPCSTLIQNFLRDKRVASESNLSANFIPVILKNMPALVDIGIQLLLSSERAQQTISGAVANATFLKALTVVKNVEGAEAAGDC